MHGRHQVAAVVVDRVAPVSIPVQIEGESEAIVGFVDGDVAARSLALAAESACPAGRRYSRPSARGGSGAARVPFRHVGSDECERRPLGADVEIDRQRLPRGRLLTRRPVPGDCFKKVVRDDAAHGILLIRTSRTAHVRGRGGRAESLKSRHELSKRLVRNRVSESNRVRSPAIVHGDRVGLVVGSAGWRREGSAG